MPPRDSRTMSKRWLTIIEIIEAKLPGMPASKHAIRNKAAREGWPSRPRKGKGGGVEYAIAALPKAAQEALASLALCALPKTAEPQRTDPKFLADWQRSAMQARALILHHIQAIALTQGTSILAIEAQFAKQAAAKTLPLALEKAVAAANQRQNAGRTISAATLRRWRGLAGEACADLAPNYTPQPLHYPWLARLMQLYARPTKPSVAWCVEEMRRCCAQRKR